MFCFKSNLQPEACNPTVLKFQYSPFHSFIHLQLQSSSLYPIIFSKFPMESNPTVRSPFWCLIYLPNLFIPNAENSSVSECCTKLTPALLFSVCTEVLLAAHSTWALPVLSIQLAVSKEVTACITRSVRYRKVVSSFSPHSFSPSSLSSSSQCLPLISAMRRLPWIHAGKRWKEPRLQLRWDTTTVLMNLSLLLRWEGQQWEEGSSQGHDDFQEATCRLCSAQWESSTWKHTASR